MRGMLIAVGTVVLGTMAYVMIGIALASVGFAWHYYIGRIRPVHLITLAVFTIMILNPVGQLWRTAYKTVDAGGPGDIPAVASEVGDEIATMGPGDYLGYAIGERFERLN